MVSIWKVNHQILLNGLCALTCGLGAPKKKEKQRPNGLAPKMTKFPPLCMLIRLLNNLASTALVTQRYFQHITNATHITMHKPSKQLQSTLDICSFGRKERTTWLFYHFSRLHPSHSPGQGIMFSSCLSILSTYECNISRPPGGVSLNFELMSTWTQVWTVKNFLVKGQVHCDPMASHSCEHYIS